MCKAESDDKIRVHEIASKDQRRGMMYDEIMSGRHRIAVPALEAIIGTKSRL